MSIKMKLLGGGGLVSALLFAVLIVAITSFGKLSGGFADVVQMSATGVDNSRTTESSVIATGKDLTTISNEMLSLVDQINQTNMQVKVLERKILNISKTLLDVNEEVSAAAEELPEGDARYAMEDTTDAVGDIEEIMRREALVSLSQTVKKIDAFTQTISAQATNIQAMKNGLDEVKSLSSDVVAANQEIRSLSQDFSAQIGVSRNVIIGVLLVTVAISLFGAFFITLAITRPLNRANEIARGIADGDLAQTVDIVGNDEIGQLGTSMSVMITNLKDNIEETQRRADEASRIRMALDVCNTNVMVADNAQTVIYQNRSSENTLLATQDALKTDIPDLDASQFVGSQLNHFHPEPQAREKILAQLDEMQQEQLVIGGRHFSFMITPVFNDDNKRLGTVMEWRDRTDKVESERLKIAQQEQAARIADANLRIRVALDNVSSSVMMADTNRDILYMNNAAKTLFKELQNDFQNDLPNFKADKLIGSSVDHFKINPEHQAQIKNNLQQSFSSETTIGGHTMRVVTNPVINEAGERLGTAVEWTNRTDEVAVENEVASIVSAAQQGDLSKRIDTDNKEGFFKNLGSDINALISQVEEIFTELADVMASMAKGNLTHTIEHQYQGSFLVLKNNVNETIDNLSGILSRLRTDMDGMHTSADEISSGNNNLSARTEQQASSLEETAASMEQLTSTVRHNADNATQADTVARTAKLSAEKGGEVVSHAIEAMQAISGSSNKIAEIIGVIDEIAFQTNLLALNASVEAARAGEQGRGFAVVATEVRNLASRSANAAKEIKTLIQDSLGKVKSGSALVNESGETLEEIVDHVKKVGDIVAEIAASSHEQTQGIESVNQAVTSMDAMTQQNAALAEQTSAASASMSEKAHALQTVVSNFVLK